MLVSPITKTAIKARSPPSARQAVRRNSEPVGTILIPSSVAKLPRRASHGSLRWAKSNSKASRRVSSSRDGWPRRQQDKPRFERAWSSSRHPTQCFPRQLGSRNRNGHRRAQERVASGCFDRVRCCLAADHVWIRADLVQGLRCWSDSVLHLRLVDRACLPPSARKRAELLRSVVGVRSLAYPNMERDP